jgi:osmoprotectant transport system substrate-binding protein
MRLRRYIQWRTLVVPLTVLLLALTACGDALDPDDEPAPDGEEEPEEEAADRDGPTITVGSFNFPESVLLAEIYAQVLESDGYPVERALDLGSRELIFPQFERGDIDLLPEYAGSALVVGFDGEATGDLDETLERLQEAFNEMEITVLEAAPGENANAFVVTEEFAEEHGLEAISDLADVDEDLALGGPPECEDRDTCLLGLQETYGLEVDFQAIQEVAPRVAALEQGDVQIALLFSTMPVIAERGLVMLEDDEQMVPAENIVPVVRNEIAEDYGDDLVALLDSVTERITTDLLIELNTEIEVDARDPRDVARDWLEREATSS